MRTVLIVTAVALAFAFVGAAAFGTSNQLTYLIDPLHRVHPELYAHDWFASATTQYHGAFARLGALLFEADDRGVIAFAIAQLVVMTATVAMIYLVVAQVTERDRLAVFLVVVSVLVLGAHRALAGTYLFSDYLQASSLATLGWLAALVLWLRDRPLLTGVCLAFAGVCHANFLMLGVVVFGALELRSRDLRRAAMILGPSVVVLAFVLPGLLGDASPADPELALRVLTKFHAPGHYDPQRVAFWLPALLGWLLVARGALPIARAEKLWSFAWVSVALCTAATGIALLYLPLTRVFVWRLAPFAQLACVVIAAIAAVTVIIDRSRARHLAVMPLAIGAAVVVTWTIIPSLRIAYLGVLVAIAIAAAIGARHAILVGAVTCAIALVTQSRGPRGFSVETGGAPYADLATWAQRSSNVDAVFLVPPYLNRFRFFARRAIVADTKSPPLYADELVVWYRRLCTIVDAPEMPTHEAVEARWDTLTAEQIMKAARTFDVDYVVVDIVRTTARLPLPAVFDNGRLVVYRVRD